MAEIASTTSNVVSGTLELDLWQLALPLDPGNGVGSLLVVEFEGPDHDREQGVHYVLGRPDPVVVKGARRTGTGSMTMYAETPAKQQAIENALATGQTVLIQGPGNAASGPGEHVFAELGDEKWEPAGPRRRQVTVAWVEVARPGPL